MRVATYVQPGTVSRSSVLAYLVCVFTVVLGSSAVHTLVTFYAPVYTPLVNVLWTALYVLALVGLMADQGINWISWMARYRILLVVLLLGTAVSISWSISQLVTTERVAHLVGCSILAVYIGFMLPLLTIMRVLALALAVLLVASVGASAVFPEFGLISYEGVDVWRGVFNSKNMLGFWSAVGVLLYLSLIDTLRSLASRALCLGMAALSLGLLAMSQSATSVLAMLVGGTLAFYLFIALRFKLGFVRMVVLAILFIGLLSLGISNIDTAGIVGRSDDLTGRGEVWRQTWALILQQPLSGYGYGTIWFPNNDTLYIQQALTDFTWVVYHAHNGFLQVASEIGLPLSCVALLMVVQQLIEIFHCQAQRQQAGVLFVLAFVVAFLVGNFSEARFLVNRELYWILFLALPISMLRQTSVLLDEGKEPAADGDASARAARTDEANVPSSTVPDTVWPITATAVAANLVQHLDDDARLAYEEDLMRQFAALDLNSAPDIDLGSRATARYAHALYPFDEDVTLDISSPQLVLDDIARASERLRRHTRANDDDGFDPTEYGLHAAGTKSGSARDPVHDDELVADFPLSADDTTRQEAEEEDLLDSAFDEHDRWLNEASGDLEEHKSATSARGRQAGSGRGGLGDLAEHDDTFDPDDYGVYHFDRTGRMIEPS